MKNNVIESALAHLLGAPSEMTKEETIYALQEELKRINSVKVERKEARERMLEIVIPKITSIMRMAAKPMTAKEIFLARTDWGVEDFNSRKITHLFMNEMKDDVEIAGDKGISHQYSLISH